jgi:hypothetical protein
MFIDMENKDGSIILILDDQEIEFTAAELAYMGMDAGELKEILADTSIALD